MEVRVELMEVRVELMEVRVELMEVRVELMEVRVDRLMTKPTLVALVDTWLDEKQTLAAGCQSRPGEAAYRRDLTGWAWRMAELSTGRRPMMPEGRHRGGPMAVAVARRGWAGRTRSPRRGDLNAENTKRALASLAREGYAPASRARMLASLRGFCGWLVRNGHLGRPIRVAREPGAGRSLPVAFLGCELRAILAVASTTDPRARTPWPARDRALVAVLAGAGLRAGELVTLHVMHVIRDGDVVLRVIGKGNKERRVPVAREVVEAIDAYLDDRRARLGRYEATAPLFVRHNGKAFTREALNYHVYKWLARAGVHKPEGEAAHAFRHTYAKGLVANGVELNAVQRLLGHANLDTTSQYLRMTAVELHSAAQAAEINTLLREVPAQGLAVGGNVDA